MSEAVVHPRAGFVPNAEHVEGLVQKVKHYLITTIGKTIDEVSIDELYRGLCFALREEIMINWTATKKTHEKYQDRRLYYFSMEFLPGRWMENNLVNTNMVDLIGQVCKRLGYDLQDIVFREHDPGLGNGGLGRLASCFLDSLATLHLPAMGYGLRYHYGIFEQQLWDGVQIEGPDCWLLQENPWEYREDGAMMSVKYGGITQPVLNRHGEKVLELKDYEEVRALPYDYPVVGYDPDRNFSVVTLRLWTTKESPRNFKLQPFNAGRLGQASENTGLTDILYPNDANDTGRRIRLKQEYLLVSASLKDIIRRYLRHHDTFEQFPDKVRIQINDTHPALVIPELVRLLTKHHGMSMQQAWEVTQTCTSYTNHTVLREALEEWDRGLFAYLLPRQLKVVEQLNHAFCEDIRKKFEGDEERVRRMSIIEGDRIRMAPLAIYGSHKVNGVAALHTQIIKKAVFKDYNEMFPDRFMGVTNGVTQRRWLMMANPELANLISHRIGQGWITDFTKIQEFAKFADDTETLTAIQTIKQRNKQRLIAKLNQQPSGHDSEGNPIHIELDLRTDSLFSCQIKRIHEYKRQLLNALHLIMVYHDLLDDPNSHPIARTAIISGKAAAGYDLAKSIIRLIHCISRRVNNDPAIQGKLKVLFPENYSVTKAEMIIPAADLSEQISTAGMEASGTGNMKFTINGALTIGTDDGANVEMRQEVSDQWWPFKFGCSSQEIAELSENASWNPYDVYSTNDKIRRAVDALRDHSLAETETEHQILSVLYYYLLEGFEGQSPDRYYVIKDLPDYYEMQVNAEKLFCQSNQWAQYVVHNIAGMGRFSSDTAIRKYSDEIWGLNSRPPEPEILNEILEAYAEHDRCRIYTAVDEN